LLWLSLIWLGWCAFGFLVSGFSECAGATVKIAQICAVENHEKNGII